MNRRKVLQGLAALPLTTALFGCRHDGDRDDHGKHDDGKRGGSGGASGSRTLQIVLQGPFAVVLQKDRNYRIRAYVPYDEYSKHEFLFQSLFHAENKHKYYHFKLDEDSLELSNRPPYIDRGFDGFNVRLPEWHIPGDLYVSLDLPRPTLISYVSSPLPVHFEPSTSFPQGQFTTIPRNHILEYRVKEGCKVHLRSEQLGDCIPLSCDDLYQQQMRLWEKYGVRETEDLRHLSMGSEVTRCSESDVCTYFLGVGLKPRMHEDIWPEDRDHALKFFNEKLLPSLYGPGIPEGKKIAQLNVTECSSSSGATISPALMPAVQRFSQAREKRIVSTENCTSPTATATSAKTIGHP